MPSTRDRSGDGKAPGLESSKASYLYRHHAFDWYRHHASYRQTLSFFLYFPQAPGLLNHRWQVMILNFVFHSPHTGTVPLKTGYIYVEGIPGLKDRYV